MDLVSHALSDPTFAPEDVLRLTGATPAQLKQWLDAGVRSCSPKYLHKVLLSAWRPATLVADDYHFTHLYPKPLASEYLPVDIINDAQDRRAYEQMQERLRPMTFEQALKDIVDMDTEFGDPLSGYRHSYDRRRGNEHTICPTLGVKRRFCPCCKKADPSLWGHALCEHYEFPSMCIVCTTNPWDRVQTIVRNVLKDEDIDECKERTGLTPSQFRLWFSTLAEGLHVNKYEIDHIRPRCKCPDQKDHTLINEWFHFTNLQPLTHAENTAKNKIFTVADRAAWEQRTSEIRACATFDNALALVRQKGINFGDTLWPWRNDPTAPKTPYKRKRDQQREGNRRPLVEVDSQGRRTINFY